MPPSYVGDFDKNNEFGKDCIWALIPGWGHANDALGGMWSSGPQKMLLQQTVGTGGSSGSAASIESKVYPYVGPVRVFEGRPGSGGQDGWFPKRTVNDFGIAFPDPQNFTVIALVRTNGGKRDPLGGYSTDRYTDLAVDYIHGKKAGSKPWYL